MKLLWGWRLPGGEVTLRKGINGMCIRIYIYTYWVNGLSDLKSQLASDRPILAVFVWFWIIQVVSSCTRNIAWFMGLHVAQEGFQRCQANVSWRTTEWGQQILVVDEETFHRVEHVKGVSNQKTIKTNFNLHHHVHIYTVIIQKITVILCHSQRQKLRWNCGNEMCITPEWC